jgi:hypothetical protein
VDLPAAGVDVGGEAAADERVGLEAARPVVGLERLLVADTCLAGVR